MGPARDCARLGVAYLAEAKVLTPSCKSFAELALRWDRHVAHEFRNVGRRPAETLLWLVRSSMIAASPLLAISRHPAF